jgi:hypothetical protein
MLHVAHVKMQLLLTVKHAKIVIFTLNYRNPVCLIVPKIIIITLLILHYASNAFQVVQLVHLPRYVNRVQ